LVVNPAALPVVVAGVEAQAYLFGYDVPDGKLQANFRLTDEESGETKIVASSAVEIVTRATSASSNFEYVLARFEPPALDPGRWHFELSFLEPAGAQVTSPPIPVLLIHGDTREKDLLWCDLRHMAGRSATGEVSISAAAPSPAEETPERQRLGRAAKRLGKDYRQVLAGLDQDSAEAARLALFELESSALGTGKGKRLTRLRSAELAIAKELSQQNPEVVLPILMLHADTHQLYRGRRLYSLTFHARAMVEILAELYAERGGSVATTAKIMASLAGYLQESNLLAGSQRLYQRGLQHDPEAPAALLGLAASFEKVGSYGNAIEVLEKLVVAAPELDEGQLRLAINLQRVGRRPRARELLLSLIERNTETWTSAVAHEEMAQDYVSAGGSERAAELLRQAIDKSPERQGLRMLLAHVYDRLGRPQLALKQLQEIAPVHDSSSASERLTYDSWPVTVLEAARREVAIEAQAAVDELAKVLTEESTGS
jgi:tetratricopeptide (TPR) repeat protein